MVGDCTLPPGTRSFPPAFPGSRYAEDSVGAEAATNAPTEGRVLPSVAKCLDNPWHGSHGSRIGGRESR